MSKKVVTNRNEYPVIFCAEINHGVLMEIIDERKIYEIAEEFDRVESMRYDYAEADTGKTFECPLELKMIQKLDDGAIQIRLGKIIEVS